MNDTTLSVALKLASNSACLWAAFDNSLSIEACAVCSKFTHQTFGVCKPTPTPHVPEASVTASSASETETV